MGPNMYITPPGSFTRFHQDGYGTVDSGHMCLSGYNEVVIFRRLPRDYDKSAINQDTGTDDVGCETLYEMPHADKLVSRVLVLMSLLALLALITLYHRALRSGHPSFTYRGVEIWGTYRYTSEMCRQ